MGQGVKVKVKVRIMSVRQLDLATCMEPHIPVGIFSLEINHLRAEELALL